MDRHNKIFKTRYDSNEIVLFENHVEIILYDNKSDVVARTIVDIEDTDKIKQHKWCLTKDKYVLSYINGKFIYLHRFIVGEKECEGMYIDHIDYNPLNNRKSNLRICSNSQNLMHRSKLAKNNTTGIHGIIWDKERNKWRVELQANNVVYALGRYDDLQEAIDIRIKAELKYFDEYTSFFVKENLNENN